MPTSSRSFTITVTTYYNSGGTNYGIDTLSYTDNCPAGTLTASLLLADSSIGATTSLTINLTLKNSLFSGSYIGVVIPSEITVAMGNTC